MRVGFIGVGAMGGRMCRNIIRKSGEDVMVFDLDVAAVEMCTELGAARAASVAELAARSEVIFTSLPTPAIVEAVGLGPDGIGEHARPGTVWFDLTTNAPAVVRHLAEALEPKGIIVLDAPVTGATMRAEAGTISLMLGGDPGLLEKYRPLLESFTSAAFHMGPVGSGCAAKIVNNMVAISYVAAAAEGIMLGVAAGLDPATLLDVLQSGSADSMGLRSQGAKALAASWAPSMALDLASKDLRLAVELAAQLNSPVPVAEETYHLLRIAQAMGFGRDDGTAVIRVHEATVGRTVHDAAVAARGEMAPPM